MSYAKIVRGERGPGNEARRMPPVPALTCSYLPIPTSLFCFKMFVCIRQRKEHKNIIACMKYVVVLEETKMYRDGVIYDFVSWCRHLLVPFFFMK